MALIDQLRQDSRLADASDDELLGLLAQHPQYRNLSDSALRYAAFGKLEGAKPEANSEPGFVAGVSAGVDQMQAMGGGLLMAAGEKLGSESTWNAGRDVYDRNMAEAGENALGYGFTDLFTNPDTSAWQWAKYTAGNLLPTMATAVASGGVGGAGARLLAGTVAKRAATQAGQAIGAYGASAGMETGAIMGETNDADVALAHGSIAGALDALPVMRALRKVGGKQVADEAASEIADQTLNQLRRTADQSIKGAAGRGLLTQALAESSTEGLQTLIEQHAKYWIENNGQSLFNNLGEANWKEVIDAAAAGGLMGGAMGAPAGIVERGRSQSAVTAEEQRRDNQTPSEQEGDADSAPVQSANVGDRRWRDAWSEYDTPPGQRAQQRKDQAINQTRQQAAASGGDALSQAQAAQQAEQMADEVTRQEQAEQAPQRAAQLGNRIQMTLDAAADLEGLARGSDQAQARLRNLQSVLNRAETAYDSGNLDLAERLTARAEGITQNLTAALNRAGSRERPLVGQLDEPDQLAGLIGHDSAPRLSAPDPSVINMGGPTADTTQYEPQARTVRRDERMTAQREGEARLREQMARQRPQLADQGIVYGEGPVDTRREDARLRTQRAFEQQQGHEPYWGRNGEYLGPDPLPDTPEREGATYSGEAVRRPSRIEGRGTPRLPDDGTIFGSGPVAGNANTGMDQPFERARMTDTGARTNADQQRAEMGRQAQQAANVARTRGPVETAYLPDNTPVRTRYRVMDMAELTPSNNEDGSVNPRFPAELQPRDRTNANSQVQVRNIAANLNPERLGRSQDAATGAPIVGADGVVESGNGRTMAIGQAYRQGRGEAYRQYVAREAATMGMDPAAVESMERPVLVRERITNVDRADFARRANESTVAGMTSYEQAQADAAALSEADIQSWAPDQTGDPLAASNRSFQRAFVSRLGNNEASRYTTRDGQASPELGTRMQRAVFAKAYADSDMVEMVTEQGEAMRNLAAALQTAAADLAIARDTGSEDVLTAIGTINDAVRLVRRSRQDGTSIRELISQQDVFSDSVPALTADLALAINTNMRSRRALSEAMRYIGRIVRQRAESERNGALFEDTTTNRDVIDEGFRQADAGQRTSSTDVSRSDRQGESAQSPDRAERAPAGPQARALRGQPLDNEWTAFSEASGTLGIPRADMPQIKAEHRGALANFLSARDIDSTEATVPASSLRPTQREFSENRVQSAKEREGGDRAILVSSDGYVVDGHHQWLAKVDQGDDVRVIQLGAPIDRVLEAAREFPSSEVDTDSALLTTYTEQDIADRERASAEAAQGEQRRRQTETQRAAADREAGDFTLSGSDRTADVAAARGQGDMLGAQDRLESQSDGPDQPRRRNQPLEYVGYSGEARSVRSYQEVGDYRIAKVHDGLYEVIDSNGQAVAQLAGPNGAVSAAQRLNAGDARYSLDDSPAEQPPTAEAVRNALTGMNGQLGDFTVVDSPSELPLVSQLGMLRDGVDGRDVRGLYSGDRLYIVAGNNESIDRAVRTAVHEAVGHKGMRGVLGDELVPVMRQLYNSLPLSKQGRAALNEVLETYTFLDRTNADDQVAIAEEMVAHLLEKGYRPKVWQRVVAKIRELLRKVFPGISWSYTDVLELGEKSRDYLRNQQAKAMRDQARYALRQNDDANLSATELAAKLREEYHGLKLDLMGRRDTITLSRIVVPEGQRGEGMGTNVMRRIAQWADANDKVLALTASSDFGGSVRRLKPFYQGFGFIENKGRNKDYEISEGMYRLPASMANQRYSLRAAPRQHIADAFDDLDETQQAAYRKIAPRTPKESAIAWFKEHTDRLGTKLRQGLVDRYAALRDMDQQLLGEDSVDGSTASSSWVLARMSSAANGALTALLNYGRIYLDPDQKVIDMRDDDSMGLGEVLGRLGSAAEIERFMGWIAGNRSVRLAAEGRENLFTPEEIEGLRTANRGTMKDGRDRASTYDEVFAEFQRYRNDVLTIAEQSGIISAENRAMWRDEFYVPFYRISEEAESPDAPRATSGLTRAEAYKKLKGGSGNLNDLLSNTMMNFHHLLQASLKNQAAMQAMDNAEAMGIASEKPEAEVRGNPDATFVLRDGKKVWYQVDDPLVYKAVSSLAHPGMNNTAMKVMRGFKRLFTNMTTTTPQFVVANLLRDSMQAAATSPLSKNIPANLFKGAKSYADKRTRARMMASGASFSFGHLYGENADELKVQLTNTMRRAELIRDPSQVPAAAKLLWRRWNDATDFTENMSRAEIYRQNEARGKLFAAFQARDLMDFSSHGAWPAVRFLIDVVPFMNARLQGLDKIGRSGVAPALRVAMGKGSATDKEAAARFWSVAGSIAMATIALYLHNWDDEEYRKLEDWQKDSYWFFRVGDTGIFIPKPFEVGAIATLAERMTEQMVDDKATGELFRERLGHMLTDTFSFSPVPQIAQPLLDVYSNYDAFTGRPIESMGMDRLSPSLRSRSSTTAPARWISNTSEALFGPEGKLTISPVQVDHLIQGYLGQVGAWGAGITDTIARTMQGETKPANYWYEYQPIRRFYQNLGDEDRYNRYGTLFYEGLNEVGRVYADIKEYRELGDQQQAMQLLNDNRDMLRMRKWLNRTQSKLSTINKRMQMVERSDNSAEFKRREMDRLRAMKNRLTEMAGRRLERVKAEG